MAEIELAKCPRCCGSDVHIVDDWHCHGCNLMLGPALPFGEPHDWPGAEILHYVQWRTCLCRTLTMPPVVPGLFGPDVAWRERKFLGVPYRPRLYMVDGVRVENAQ
jgi:hypothetical protein